MQPVIKQYWEQLQKVGEEVLEQGRKMGFGTSLVEIKFQDGTPSVITRSISINTLYPDTDTAMRGIAQELNDSIHEGFDGARTFTVVYQHGGVKRVLLDEYASRKLK